MRKLEEIHLEKVNGGDFIDGLCGGALLGEGVIGIAAVAVNYGWIAAIPGLGQAALIVGAGAAITCGISAIN